MAVPTSKWATAKLPASKAPDSKTSGAAGSTVRPKRAGEPGGDPDEGGPKGALVDAPDPSRRRFVEGALSLAALAASPVVSACAVHTPSRTTTARTVTQAIAGQRTRDGAGVKLTRLLGGRPLPMLDPFLLLDEFRSDDPADFIKGFPKHPHRGFETVSILFDGHIEHKDSVGNHGDIGSGGVQWMTAGRGILHEEMPRPSETTGGIWGYQLWVNLPAAQKMRAPRYQDLRGSAFDVTPLGDGEARVLAGRFGMRRGPIDGVAIDPVLIDLRLDDGAVIREKIPGDHTAFLFVADGAIAVGGASKGRVGRTGSGEIVPAGTLAVLSAGDTVALTGKAPSRALLVAGAPIGEPVARRGPFVMNTDAELRQAFADYRSGRLTDG